MFGYFVIGLAVLWIGFLIFIIVGGKIRNRKKDSSKILDVRAKLVDKGNTCVGLNQSESYASFNMVFQVDNGDELSFKVGEEEYDEIEIGDIGILQFQGKRFLGFKK